MKKLALPLLLASLLMATVSNCFADEQQSYGSQVGNKALNGFANITTAVLEIPKNIINTTNDSNFAYGIAGGLGKGILNTVGRIVTGMTDLITAPLPTKPIAYPLYVWDDFDEDTTYGEVFRLQE
ncbi:MAG: exosortase system-associated protein, TIGR04073 family [Methylococcaceae bacterium]|nr:exosortase system-associated protein, TIGR04073 family [Methylococcaceae bacterium]